MKISDRKNINELVKKCTKNAEITNRNNTSRAKYKTKSEYEASFTDIIDWKKGFKDDPIFDIIFYHKTKSDGLFCAGIYYHYLMEQKKYKDTHELLEHHKFIGTDASRDPLKDPRSGMRRDEMRDKKVLILDLSLSPDSLKEIQSTAKELLVIDDHESTNKRNNKLLHNVFVGSNHSACAYCWKFFFTDKEVPIMVQIIDSDDRKLFLPWIGMGTNFVATALGFMFSHSPYPHTLKKIKNGEIVADIWDVIGMNNSVYFITIGRYMEEGIENLKEQIARMARADNFLGYKVGTLNYFSPMLPKKVARQIISNFKARGEHIDFVVLYAYERTQNAYHIQMLEEHTHGTPKYNLAQLAIELGKLGKTSLGGHGAKFIGNFYWKRIPNKQDIWDLFEAKSINELKNKIK